MKVRERRAGVWKRRALCHPDWTKRLLQFGAEICNVGFANILFSSISLSRLRGLTQDEPYQKLLTNPSILPSICAFSLSETACGGVYNPWPSPKTTRFKTQHQIGTLLLNASGMLFPLLVESTITQPPRLFTTSNICRFSLLKLKLHSPICPSVLLKYTLSDFWFGGIYQLPHRSLATSGRSYAEATDATNWLSEMIEERRL